MKVEKAKRLAQVSDLKKTHLAAVRHLAMKNRILNPDGRFDGAGRFYLDNKCSCCWGIRSPSRGYPYPEMTHGRSAVHVANSFGVDVRDLRIISKLIEEEPDLKNFATFFQAFGMALTADATAAIDGVLEQLISRKGA